MIKSGSMWRMQTCVPLVFESLYIYRHWAVYVFSRTDILVFGSYANMCHKYFKPVRHRLDMVWIPSRSLKRSQKITMTEMSSHSVWASNKGARAISQGLLTPRFFIIPLSITPNSDWILQTDKNFRGFKTKWSNLLNEVVIRHALWRSQCFMKELWGWLSGETLHVSSTDTSLLLDYQVNSSSDSLH